MSHSLAPMTGVTKPTEPADIGLMRRCLAQWPFAHGKGILMRAFQPFLDGREFIFEIEPGVLVVGRLDDYMVRAVFMRTLPSERAWRFSRSLILPGDTVIDAGAHIGLWLMGAARRLGSGGAVHAFEPIPENYHRLHDNLTLNGLSLVRCQNIALADTWGTTCMYAASHGNSAGASMAWREGVDRQTTISVTTLDRYCDEKQIARVHFLKVDVEGAELMLFRGAERLLTRSEAPAIMFEVGEELASPLGSSSSQVKELLEGYGYRIFEYTRRHLVPIPTNWRHDGDDLFAFKPHHFHRFEFLADLVQEPRSPRLASEKKRA